MTPVLLFPLGLAALAALIVPLLMHLRRRTEEVPLDFAAMRWLDPLPRPRRKIRFDELLLLAVRLLLVALLALLLARPAVFGVEDKDARVLVSPDVDPARARQVAGPTRDVHWIAPGFPALTEAPPRPAALSSLIRQFDAELPARAPLTILVPPVLDGVDAAPLRLTRPVRWRIVEGSVLDQRVPRVPAPAIAVRYAPGTVGAVRYFRAASTAWGGAAHFTAETGDVLPARQVTLVWLKAGPVPAAVTDWVADGGTALLGDAARVTMPGATGAMWRDAGGATLVEGAALGRGRLLRFVRPLTPAAMPDLLDASFAERLREVLASPARPPARVMAADFAPAAGVAPFALPPRELAPWLAVLIAAVFLAERWLATRRRRWAA